MLALVIFMATVAGAWYLLVVHPQRAQQQRHLSLLDQLRPGDEVLTVGGMYGRVSSRTGDSVDLELSPGTTTRVAPSAIARIVQSGQAPRDETRPTTQRVDENMQQPHQQHDLSAPQPALQLTPVHPPQTGHLAPTYAAPPLPQFGQRFASHPSAQRPTAPPPAPHYTGVASAPTQSFEPRPWADVQPVARQAPAPAAIAAPAAHQPQSAPMQPIAVPFASPVGTRHQYTQPDVMNGYDQSYATQVDLAMHGAPTGGSIALMTWAAPGVSSSGAAAPHAIPRPRRGDMQHASHDGGPESVAPVRVRKHSPAPSGMGSSLRLDDPSLHDVLARARAERTELADEYRRASAPLVDTRPAPHHAPQAGAQHRQLPHVGYAQDGTPLFAHPSGQLVTAPVTEHGIPRPQLGAPMPDAFQRPTPYAQPRLEHVTPMMVDPLDVGHVLPQPA